MDAAEIGKIDEVIHGRMRLGIMVYLAEAEVAKVVACFAYFADEDVAARVRLTASQRIQRVEP